MCLHLRNTQKPGELKELTQSLELLLNSQEEVAYDGGGQLVVFLTLFRHSVISFVFIECVLIFIGTGSK